ncbi:hypothetical protein CU102_13540 [Phyllobacterium brassicacearum]|uniref:Uncharacterized protein n=2 Tax=Phyllobacterium brassicacearum TaxID=314235 RepID=A0A2P7BPD3_9HYPH|nr:hypothetical protein CU102_13540 [Phyllobacterium brassicacearum]TDQ31823.1 hypothetical protein DEV91_107162 [Phyllobacterium brassicacearum]
MSTTLRALAQSSRFAASMVLAVGAAAFFAQVEPVQAKSKRALFASAAQCRQLTKANMETCCYALNSRLVLARQQKAMCPPRSTGAIVKYVSLSASTGIVSGRYAQPSQYAQPKGLEGGGGLNIGTGASMRDEGINASASISTSQRSESTSGDTVARSETSGSATSGGGRTSGGNSTSGNPGGAPDAGGTGSGGTGGDTSASSGGSNPGGSTPGSTDSSDAGSTSAGGRGDREHNDNGHGNDPGKQDDSNPGGGGNRK